MGCIIIPPNKDVIVEILLLLRPVKPLLRFRSVCRFWRDVIDSPSFRKSYNQLHEDDGDDNTVYLQVDLPRAGKRKKHNLSIKFLDNGKSLKCSCYDILGAYMKLAESNNMCDLVWPAVRGLIGINYVFSSEVPIAVCNPCLGLIKMLPISSSCLFNHCGGFVRHVGIGFDHDEDEYYKVVELIRCCNRQHHKYHTLVYSRRTNSWRELAGDASVLDRNLVILKPIESTCKNGYFAYWQGLTLDNHKMVILTFDMRTESFQIIRIPHNIPGFIHNIIAKDDGHGCSFLLFTSYCGVKPFYVTIYELRCDGGSNYVMLLKPTFCGAYMWRRRRNYSCVVLKGFIEGNELLFYDFRGWRFVGSDALPTNWDWKRSDIVQYRGSLVSP